MTLSNRKRWFPAIVIGSVLTAELLYRLSGLMDWTANFLQRPEYLEAYFWSFPLFLTAGLLSLGRWRSARNHAALWMVAGTLMSQLSGTLAFVLAAFLSYGEGGFFLDGLLTVDGLTAFLFFSLAGPVVIGLSWFQGAISSLLTYTADKLVERGARPYPEN